MTKNLPHHTEHLIHPKYRPDIDGLRAVAVLSVIGYHAFPSIVPGGFIGVDVFFVISGYLISSIIFNDLDSGTFSFKEFYSRRIKRIFPALILVLVIVYIAGWLTLLPEDFKQLGAHIAGGAGHIQNFILWGEAGYFDTSSELKPLLHLWSLAIEEQYYLLYPLLLWVLWRLRLNAFFVIALLLAMSLALNISDAERSSAANYFLPQERIWELLAGGLLLYLIRKRTAINRRDVAFKELFALFGLLLIGAAAFGIQHELLFSGWSIIPVVGACLLIFAGPDTLINRSMLGNPVMVFVGMISFPLYLWHWPLLSFAHMFELGATPLKARAALVVASIFLAWLTYKIIEKPVRFGGQNSATSFVLCALMMAIGLVGYVTYKSDGLSFRFPADVQSVTNFQFDYKSSWRAGTCFLMPEQDKSAFGACASQPKMITAQSIILWGDSYAAHLYPGLEKAVAGQFRFIQLTSSGCPPILNLDVTNRPHCREINAYVFNRISKEKPSRIILAGLWNNYNWEAISATLEQIQKIGVKQIDLVGPVPQWKAGLPKSIYRFYRQDMRRRLPQRMSFGLTPGIDILDEKMRQFSAEHHVNYISPMHILCNKEGCLTRVGDNLESLTAWDYGHLTAQGSEFLVSHFPVFSVGAINQGASSAQ